LTELLNRLRNLEESLADAHKRVEQNIQAVENLLHRNPTLPLSRKRQPA
jgi:hypothetical protein